MQRFEHINIQRSAAAWTSLTGRCLCFLRDTNFNLTVLRRVHKTAKGDYELRHVCPSVCSYVRMEQLASHWRAFMKLEI
jgi:hypothetical protein